MEKKDIIYFIQKILKGTATPADKAEVDRYFQDAFQAEGWNEEKYGDQDQAYERISSTVNERIGTDKETKIVKLRVLMRYAASLVLFLGIAGLLYYYTNYEGQNNAGTNAQLADNLLRPGLDIASLELSDGTLLDLNNIAVGDELVQSGVIVTKTDEGNLQYVFNDKGATSAELEWNTLTTPIGGKYQIVLVDGTKVWLNSASSIRFPSRFDQDQRFVSVSGEVYFEVAHDASKPFLVNTEGVEVQVLGTKFNMSSYRNEGIGATPTVALLEGSVRLKPEVGADRVLAPGEKASVKSTGITVGKFDIESEMAWKDNYFIFKDQNIRDIMGALSRWYNAEVVYSGEGWQHKNFTIRMSRRENIEEILSILELTKSVEFKIEGRRITVQSK